MASCSSCGTMILFGGIREGDDRFCKEACRAHASAGAAVPPAEVLAEAARVRNGPCPQCARSGSPIEVRMSHRAMSFIFVTQWSSQPHLSCRGCYTRAAIGDTLLTLVLGWWGFPFGLLLTPIQVIRNLGGLFSAERPNAPASNALKAAVRKELAMTARRPVPVERPAPVQ